MTPLTLRVFYTGDSTTPVFDSCRPGEAEAAFRAAVKQAGKDAWPNLMKTYSDLTDGFFDVRVEDVLAEGWDKIADFASCLKRSRENPQETCRCHLWDHDIEAGFEPRIEVTCEGKVVSTIPLEITLTLTIEGLELEIVNGAITAVCTGALRADAKFAVQGQVLIDKPTGPIALPGRLDFTERPVAAAPMLAAAEVEREPALA